MVERQTARILSLDVDGRAWPEVGRRDPVVKRLQLMFPGFRPVNWSNAYEAAAWCIISTRIAMRQGQAIKARMSEELGDAVDIHGDRLWCFPAPARLASLRGFPGLFPRKVDYLNALGRAALAGELDTEALRSMTHDDAITALKRLPGIGDFGSELVRLRALSAVDDFPVHEPRLLSAITVAYGLDAEPSPSRLEHITRRWRPYRMWVAVCLRRTLAGGAGMAHSRAAR